MKVKRRVGSNKELRTIDGDDDDDDYDNVERYA
jgi:hypothetical protein